ncbi:MAG TPA: sigma-70 family RNA polymerase sigma factor [Verrucomicrobiae bacterium]
MMTHESVTTVEYIPDAELVARTLAGDRDAFNRIVSRYQILICSLAYSRIGHLGHSEDVAQETFITAWKRLRLLRQPEKLRAWLCGIVHNRAKQCLRNEGRLPLQDAEPLETAADLPAHEALPSEQTISHEEQAILWRSLEKIPELYREPLILFYREHRSIEHVAAELELSEDAVKQRLSRGRKLLQEGIEDFVEKTLSRTAPTPAFSNAVLAALPLSGGSATAAGIGAAGKGTLAAKTVLGAFLLPFIGVFTGFGAQWLMFQGRGSHVSKLRLVLTWLAVLTFAIGGNLAVSFMGRHFDWSGSVFFAAEAGFWWFYAMCMATWIITIYRHVQKDLLAGAAPRTSAAPMTSLRYGCVVAGTHIMMFWGLIQVAWRQHDRLGLVAVVGMAAALAVVNFFRYRSWNGSGMGPAYIEQLTSCSVVMLAIINLRLDVWVASSYGISMAELYSRIPVWIIPALSAVLVLWSVFMLSITKPKATGPVSA